MLVISLPYLNNQPLEPPSAGPRGPRRPRRAPCGLHTPRGGRRGGWWCRCAPLGSPSKPKLVNFEHLQGKSAPNGHLWVTCANFRARGSVGVGPCALQACCPGFYRVDLAAPPETSTLRTCNGILLVNQPQAGGATGPPWGQSAVANGV
jgi:hypothetical protein